MTRVALLCSGLGRVRRGHEVFADQLYALLRDDVDLTLYKGGGAPAEREVVVPSIARDSPLLAGVHVVATPKWRDAAAEMERMRVEGETFAWGALAPLLEGGFDVIHCLEQEVCTVLYGQRHLFARTPRFLWSNGGALPAADIPPCDFVQEHTEHNLRRSLRGKAFVIPHGVDTARFRPGLPSDFRARHGIPPDAFVVISVGAVGYWHKRMDHVIREVAAVPGAWLVIAGQETPDTPAIRALGDERMRGRIVFTSLPHAALPAALAAADVFVLGSLFETFGIAYIEAMACGLPVVCTEHPNQRGIVREGVFVDMGRPGALAAALRDTPAERWAALRAAGPRIAREHYDLAALKVAYVERYAAIAAADVALPRLTPALRLSRHVRHLLRSLRARLGPT